EIFNLLFRIFLEYLNLLIKIMIKKKIHTLFIVAYNKDLNFYYSISESIHSILYCNVVVCNSANYGGSHAFTPYRESYKREVLKLHGNEMEIEATVTLP